ncbi:hypothetical protein AB4160_12870 [Shewanella sp. 10N.286.51.B8]|uniref:hypothetical protein n=1 Tax=Shewanella sp. 10N.286.51.B8 TaxID=3229708 RepID=UPI0035500BE8
MKRTIINTTVISAIFAASTTFAIAAGGGAVVASDPNKHFDAKGKEPSKFTIDQQNNLRK